MSSIYAACALTGMASTYGNVEVEGMTLAVEQFNENNDLDGKKVELVVEDTQSGNVQMMNAVRKLMTFNHANVILGLTWLDSYQSILSVSDREDVFLFTPSAAIAAFKEKATQHPLVFSTWFNIQIEVDRLLAHIKNEGKKKLVLAFDQDPFFQTVRTLIKKSPLYRDFEITFDESFQMQAADFRSMLAKIKGAKVDGVIFGFGDEKNILTFLKQRHEVAPDLQLYGTEYLDGYASQSQWISYFDKVDYVSPRIHDESFVTTYQKRFGHVPVLSASPAYDAARILLQAFKANHRNPGALRAYLIANEFPTATYGTVRFDSFGAVQSSEFIVKQVRDGEIREASIP